MMHRFHSGFTLVEMIAVMVITGIIGGIVATFLLAPVRGYTDLARRAELTDIADTALRRIARDIRTALPNSVRVRGAVSGPGSCNGSEICYSEFLPTTGSGRYRAAAAPAGASAGCGSLAADVLDFTAADTCFEVLGPMPTLAVGNLVAVYNRGIAGANAYAGDNISAIGGVAGNAITIAGMQFPFRSPGNRFQVINTPVTYECAPATDAAGNGTGTLTRWQGYAIQAGQPIALPAGGSSAVLANRVSACTVSYGAVGASLSLVTLQLTLADSGENVTLYSSTHVSNVP